MRSRNVIAAAVALAALTPVAAASSEKSPVRIIAADQAAAKAAVIHLSDFSAGSGWTADKPTPDDNEKLNCGGFNPPDADLVTTGQAKSAFKHPSGFQIESEADLLRTARMVQLDWQRTVADPRMLPCMRKTMVESSKGTKVRVVSLTRIPFPHLSQYLAVYRMQTRVPVNGGHLDAVSDFVLFGVGRAELSLFFTGPYIARDAIKAAEIRFVGAMLGRCG